MMHEYAACTCGHSTWAHSGGDEKFCYVAGCECTSLTDGALIVNPGHDRFGTEFALATHSVQRPVLADADIILDLHDQYAEALANGTHPELTVGGATWS